MGKQGRARGMVRGDRQLHAGGQDVRGAALSDERDRALPLWLLAHVAGAAMLLWVALLNGFPLLFADSGAYLRVGTELYYPLDRPVSYGLLIWPFARIAGPWAVVIAQALFATWVVGLALSAIMGRRAPLTLAGTMAALAALSSLPWFAGQVMPDLFTGLMALVMFTMIFAPMPGWRGWAMAALLAGLIALHLSHLPIAAALIVAGGLLTGWRMGAQPALARVAPAAAALALALAGLCAVNLAATHVARPVLQSDKFLVARLLDGHVGQPVLDRLCAREQWRLCAIRAYADNPRRTLPGQDYLWAADSPRAALEHTGPSAFRAEEAAFARRVMREDPAGVTRLALIGWRDQLLRARPGDGLIAYPPQMQVARQIHAHFPASAAAFDASLQQRGALQRWAAMTPDRTIAMIIVLLTPFVVRDAARRGYWMLVALSVTVLTTIIANAAVCGALSGPADRYQSRVLWLLPMLGLVAAVRLAALPARRPVGVSVTA